MVLECVMLCIDNSEYSRNGDYSPSRFQSEVEACSLLASQKLQSNPETTVGLLSLAGGRVAVHVSPTRSTGAIMTALSKEVHISGHSNFLGGLKTAALALKNRQNKNQRQRIIAFVGSPVDEEVGELVRLAKTFKKNNIAVDLINFGAENAANENPEKLEQFIAAVKNAEFWQI
jgi:26S proteasome regulatory subunit N10